MQEVRNAEVLETLSYVCPRDHLRHLPPLSIAQVERGGNHSIYIIVIYVTLPAFRGPAEVWLRILEVNQSSMPMVYHRVKLSYYYREKHFRHEKPGCRYMEMMHKAVPFSTHSTAIKVSLRAPDEISLFVEGTHPLLHSSVMTVPHYPYADFCEALFYDQNKWEMDEVTDQLTIKESSESNVLAVGWDCGRGTLERLRRTNDQLFVLELF